ncbi:SagB/ThcOx family dehydrogenase, partial [Candidatus Latescibacterota bacterium]
MKKAVFIKTISLLTVLVIFTCPVLAQDLKPIKLPAPQTTGGMPLMDALKNRHTSRSFSTKELSPQVMSNLLWAAFGINREDGRRTAPSAVNWQTLDVYVATANGMYRHDPVNNVLEPVVAKDLRALTGKQPFVKDAPVNLVYVANYDRIKGDMPEAQKERIGSLDSGYIGQNVYLYCASEGLETVVRGLIDKPAL